MSNRRNSPLPYPSRLMLNAGILTGAVVGIFLQSYLNSDNVQAFLVTGGCCLIGALIFTAIDIKILQKR